MNNSKTVNAKHTISKNGKTYYYIGTDIRGFKTYLEEASWDCDWYWGFGYLKNFYKDGDIREHYHFDSSVFRRGYDTESFRELFPETPLTDKEIYTLNELMRAFYILGEYAELSFRGGAHITESPAKSVLKDLDEHKRISEQKIPELFKHIYELLDPNHKKGA